MINTFQDNHVYIDSDKIQYYVTVTVCFGNENNDTLIIFNIVNTKG